MQADHPHDLVLAPAILSADLTRLGDEVRAVEQVASWLHVDVMDAHYVPELTIGPPVARAIRRITDCHIDAHLMVSDPRTLAAAFIEAGANSITFHPETDDDPIGLIDQLHRTGALVGVALTPGRPLSTVTGLLPRVDLLVVMTVEPGLGPHSFIEEVVPTIAEADAWRRDNHASLRLQVDGGLTAGTVARTAEAGADTFVAGSGVFRADDRAAAVRSLLDAAHSARS